MPVEKERRGKGAVVAFVYWMASVVLLVSAVASSSCISDGCPAEGPQEYCSNSANVNNAIVFSFG
jgi:hypothetical protein